jgi:hypothetical protein
VDSWAVVSKESSGVLRVPVYETCPRALLGPQAVQLQRWGASFVGSQVWRLALTNPRREDYKGQHSREHP